MIRKSYYFLVVVVLMGLDQLTKALIVRSITLQGSREVIPGFFNLTHVRNRGAIFGFLSHSDSRILYIFLTLVSVAALGLVIYYFFKTPVSERLMKISLSLILAGAMGNLIDRLFRGHVIDFLDFYVKDWHWPSFNVADSCITVGAFLLIYILIFKRGPECTPSS
ncbi:MAG: signal peptidase II [Candidatus Aminicenantes bacterium]|jgi:signal peptidase II|nr:signal peptidase II [Candidatus Aminicenantes bacterium]MCK4760078.1 signal peptidase II [Candidatus Aminicenantes bacterium]